MEKLRVASCQFPVTEDVGRNARHIRRYIVLVQRELEFRLG